MISVFVPADEDILDENTKQHMTTVSEGILEGTKEFVMSTVDTIVTIGDGFVGAVLDPVGTADKINHVFEHPIETAQNVGSAVVNIVEHVGDATVQTYETLADPDASAGAKAKVATRAVLEVGTLFVGGGGVKSLASGASVTTKAIGAERVVLASAKAEQRVAAALAAADARLAGTTSSSQLARELTKVAQVPHVSDVALREILSGEHALFRPGATVGNGGTAAAVRHTKETAQLVGGSNHIEKLAKKQTELAKWLVKNANDANVSAHDVGVARNLLQETIDAQAQLHAIEPHAKNAARAALLVEQEEKLTKEQEQEQEQEEIKSNDAQQQEQQQEDESTQAEINSLENQLATEEHQLADAERSAAEEDQKARECDQTAQQLEAQMTQQATQTQTNSSDNKKKLEEMIAQLRRRSSQHRSSAAKHGQRAQQTRARITSLQTSLQSLRSQLRARATVRC
jgi:hypothetical protein